MNVSLSYTGQLEIKVKIQSDAIELLCGGGNSKIRSKNGEHLNSLKLEYKDENSGEYACVPTDNDLTASEESKILVKFRSKFCSKKIVLLKPLMYFVFMCFCTY